MAINDKGLCWICEKKKAIGTKIFFSGGGSNDNRCESCRKKQEIVELEEREFLLSREKRESRFKL